MSKTTEEDFEVKWLQKKIAECDRCLSKWKAELSEVMSRGEDRDRDGENWFRELIEATEDEKREFEYQLT
jgi:hypothetical protein